MGGIFLEMDALEGHAGKLAVGNQRIFVLADLVTLGDIRIEIFLTVPFGEIGYLAIHGRADREDALDGLLVQYRQCTWMAQTDRADIRIWLSSSGSFLHEQNIFELVLSSACISRPIVGIYFIFNS